MIIPRIASNSRGLSTISSSILIHYTESARHLAFFPLSSFFLSLNKWSCATAGRTGEAESAYIAFARSAICVRVVINRKWCAEVSEEEAWNLSSEMAWVHTGETETPTNLIASRYREAVI